MPKEAGNVYRRNNEISVHNSIIYLRRTSQLSIATLIEMARGQNGALAVGLQTKQPGSEGLGGVEYILNCTLEDDMDNPKVMKHWQWLLGRLLVVERLIEEFPHEFYLLYIQLYPSSSSSASTGIKGRTDENHRQKLLNYHRLTTLLGFAKKAVSFFYILQGFAIE